jgi:hypothetical protein
VMEFKPQALAEQRVVIAEGFADLMDEAYREYVNAGTCTCDLETEALAVESVSDLGIRVVKWADQAALCLLAQHPELTVWRLSRLIASAFEVGLRLVGRRADVPMAWIVAMETRWRAGWDAMQRRAAEHRHELEDRLDP